jgi:hypothetical protein
VRIQPMFILHRRVFLILSSYRMFEPNMDDYLDDEMEELKRAFEIICKDWERSVSLTAV